MAGFHHFSIPTSSPNASRKKALDGVQSPELFSPKTPLVRYWLAVPRWSKVYSYCNFWELAINQRRLQKYGGHPSCESARTETLEDRGSRLGLKDSAQQPPSEQNGTKHKLWDKGYSMEVIYSSSDQDSGLWLWERRHLKLVKTEHRAVLFSHLTLWGFMSIQQEVIVDRRSLDFVNTEFISGVFYDELMKQLSSS